MELSEAAKADIVQMMAELIETRLSSLQQVPSVSPGEPFLLNTSFMPNNQALGQANLRRNLFQSGTPPKFSGKQCEAAAWLRRYEQICSLNGLSGDELLHGVGWCFEDMASDWFWSRVVGLSQGQNLTWSQFRRKFCSTFINDKEKARLLHAICGRYQRHDETLSCYAYSMLSMCSEYDPSMDEAKVIGYVTQGMKEIYKGTVLAYLRTQGRTLDKLDEIVQDLSSEKYSQRTRSKNVQTNGARGASTRGESQEQTTTSILPRQSQGQQKSKTYPADVICYNCMGKGHYVKDCTEKKHRAKIKRYMADIKKKREGDISASAIYKPRD